ncbi:MAG: XdhC family protein [Dehalococcoidia bacterium]
MQNLVGRLLAAAAGGDPVVQTSVLEPGPLALLPGTRMLVDQSGERLGSLGSSELDELVLRFALDAFQNRFAGTVYVGPDGLSERSIAGATSVYVELVASKPVFLVVGAGHIGRSLARLADREDFASEEKIPEADEVICGEFGPTLDAFPITPTTSVVLVTRGHRQDEEALRHCLGRGAEYLGMIGSRRRTATVLRHLVEEGFAAADLDAVRTPIGLDLGAETPEEIAISIMAEVLMLRSGASGKPLYTRSAGADQA